MYPYYEGGNWGSGMMSWGGGWFGLIFMVFWWVVIIVVAILLIRWAAQFKRMHMHRGEEKSPIEITKERYAKGEITRKEFEEMKKDLQ